MSVGNFNWFAVYTKPQQEQIALLNLERQSFECYLPMAEDSGLHRKAREKAWHEPLFPRYLFLGASPRKQCLAAVRSTRGVVGLVRAGLELIKIPTSVIAGLKTRMHPVSGLIPLDPIALNSGDRVQVFEGPFADMEGVFQEHRGQMRSLLLLDILGRKTAVEVDVRSLKPLS